MNRDIGGRVARVLSDLLCGRIFDIWGGGLLGYYQTLLCGRIFDTLSV